MQTGLALAGASVDAVGLAAQTIYFHKLLADEIGLDVDFLQVGKYKGAEEPFTRDGPSPEARASLESTLSDMRSVWLDGLRAGRPAAAEAAPEDGPYSAPTAKEQGLVDHVGYFDEAREALEREAAAVRAVVRLGGGAAAGGGDDLSDCCERSRANRSAPRPSRLSAPMGRSRWRAVAASSAKAAGSSRGASCVR